MRPEFVAYIKQVKRNAVRLAARLSEHGYVMVTGGTDNHLLLWCELLLFFQCALRGNTFCAPGCCSTQESQAKEDHRFENGKAL